MKWYQILSDYGVTEMQQIDNDDDDIRLLGKLVDKIIIPKLSRMANILNPFSSKQMKASVELIDQVVLSSSGGKDSQRFKDLISSFTDRLTSIVNSIEYDTLSLGKISLLESIAFYRNRYFWRNFKLLANLLLWRTLLPPENLRSLIDQLLDRCLLPLLSTGGVSDNDKYRKILELVPGEWMSQYLLEKIARGAVGF
ncbi:1446_t:CDS:2 [Ambispora gerdemannii]|uniref:1446_t:CDS:1 n=1 Tax=Ambispora gerdemannii TaxID=144530 RepID=A0A9N8YLQ2_9GLOM|nr:1446_t:CDS:2 [Ambispora gerdemannii]